MSKNKFKNSIQFLRDLFHGDDESSEALDFLERKAADIDWPEEKPRNGQDFTLPEAVEGMKNNYALFSDGACRGNPGPGAWGAMAQDWNGAVIYQGSGVDVPTTNNRMELEGAICAIQGLLSHLHDSGKGHANGIFLYSDSKYVVDGIESWVPNWKNRGWKKADKKAPENVELWKTLDGLVTELPHIQFSWVKGHAGHPQNEYCDHLANQALNEAGF